MQVFTETTLDRCLYKLYLGPVLCFLHFLTSQNEMNLLTLLNFFHVIRSPWFAACPSDKTIPTVLFHNLCFFYH